MRSRGSLRRALGIACVLFAGLAGCSTDKGAPPAERVNEYRANANNRIVSQSAFGDVDKNTSVFELETNGAGAHPFRGRYNSNNGAGSLSASGALSWFHGTAYTATDFTALPSTGV